MKKTRNTITFQIPSMFKGLNTPCRYKVFYGGRGAGKSWVFAQQLLMFSLQSCVRILCAREYQISIADSVHKLLCDQIYRLGLDKFFSITKTQIRSTIGSEFIFKGLHHNAQEIKSLEGVDYCWCFIAGTLVDGKPIESIKQGDVVCSYNHITKTIEKRRVVRCMKRKAPNRLYKLTFAGSNSITGTEEHPIYVKGLGYMPLSKIKKGDVVYACETESSRNGSVPWWLRIYCRNRYTCKASKLCQKMWNILQGLSAENAFREDEKKQSNAEQRNKGEDVKSSSLKRTQANRYWREWERIHKSTKDPFKRTWKRMVARIYRPNWSLQRRKQFTYEFQDRYSQCLLWNCDRIRRWKSYGGDCFTRGREKNYLLTEQRVDSIEIQEQAGLERSSISDEGNYVYNLEVEGNNNYFANGLLVHNCEEAQSVSRESWELLIPTIRKEGSEIWISFNPDSPDDETYRRFVKNPPSNALVVKVGWKDNPWFPKTLEAERVYCKKVDPEGYEHIWGGEPRTISDAQIFKGRFEVKSFDTPSDARFFHGVDWGFAKDPTALIRMFVKDDCLYIDQEAYGVGIELDELPTLFDSISTTRSWPIKADAARPETISYMAKRGFRISAAKKWAGSVLDGIALLKSFARIYIHERCKHTAEEFKLYQYKIDKITQDILPIPMDLNNHCIDSARYALDGYIRRPGLKISANIMRPNLLQQGIRTA